MEGDKGREGCRKRYKEKSTILSREVYDRAQSGAKPLRARSAEQKTGKSSGNFKIHWIFKNQPNGTVWLDFLIYFFHWISRNPAEKNILPRSRIISDNKIQRNTIRLDFDFQP